MKGVQNPLLSTDRPLPKRLFKKVTFLDHDFYLITDSGILQFLRILSSFTPQLLEQSKENLARKRIARISSRTRKFTNEEKDKLLHQIGFSRKIGYLSECFPQSVAEQQARWECFRSLNRSVSSIDDLAKWLSYLTSMFQPFDTLCGVQRNRRQSKLISQIKRNCIAFRTSFL